MVVYNYFVTSYCILLWQMQQSAIKYLQQQQNLRSSLLSLFKHQSLQEPPSLDKSFSNLLVGSTSAVSDGGGSLERAARFHRNAAGSLP